MECTIVSILYIFVGVIYLMAEFRYVKRINRISLISMFRFMYAFIYGFLPALFLLRIEAGTSSMYLIFSNDKYARYLFWGLIVSLFEYMIIGFVYRVTRPSKKYHTEVRTSTIPKLSISVCIMLIVGFLSLFLWTRAYGSVANMIIHADAVRARYSNIYNPFAFLEHFTKTLTISAFASFAALVHKKRKGKNTFTAFILFAFSLLGTITVSLSTDSRGSYGKLLICLFLLYYCIKDAGKYDVMKLLRKLATILVIAFVIIIASEPIMNALRTDSELSSLKFDAIETIEREFGYTFQSIAVCIHNFVDNSFSFLFINDLVNSLTAWLPSRFIPFDLPIGLWDHNTEVILSYYFFYGQVPTDFVTASIYQFGLIGIVILPIIFAWILKKIETIFWREKFSTYLCIFYVNFMYYCLWWSNHFALENTILSFFGMVLAFIIIKFVSMMKVDNPVRIRYNYDRRMVP